MGELKSKVRYILSKYLNDELVDDEFKMQITKIIDEFYNDADKFRRIWILLNEIEPKIENDLEHWMRLMSK